MYAEVRLKAEIVQETLQKYPKGTMSGEAVSAQEYSATGHCSKGRQY